MGRGLALIGRNGDIKIDMSQCVGVGGWRKKADGDGGSCKKTGESLEEMREKERKRRGMYGDFESCDSTIKLGEFCSWRGVSYSPHSTHPFTFSFHITHPFPFHRSAVIYGLIRLIFYTTIPPPFPYPPRLRRPIFSLVSLPTPNAWN